jgi:hypothetical protein
VKALNVHGGGASSDNTSCKVGRRAPCCPAGMARLKGLDDKSPEDMKSSSSASQSERTDEQRGDVSLEDMWMCSEGGFRIFDFRIALRKYFMGPLAVRPPFTFRQRIPTLSLTSFEGLCAYESAATIRDTEYYRVKSIQRTSYLYREVVEEYLARCLLLSNGRPITPREKR